MLALVTGGAGFIGSKLVRQLIDQGARVVAVDNLVNGKRENLEGLNGDWELIVADIQDDVRMRELMKSVEVVFHLACLGVRHSIHSPHQNHGVNATATLGLLAAAKECGVKRFVSISTSEVYGRARVPMTEEHPTFPTTVYGAAKLAGECYARAFYFTYHYPTVIVRLFNAYGPRSHHEGDSGEVIPRFMLRCLAGQPMVVFGDGSQTREFTFVSDLARGILLVGLANNSVGQTVNLGTGQEITINDLAHEVAAVVGQPQAKVIHHDPRPGDVLRVCADTTKARELFGFEPKWTLHEGLERLKNWYLSLGKSPEELLKEEIVRNWER